MLALALALMAALLIIIEMIRSKDSRASLVVWAVLVLALAVLWPMSRVL